MNLTCWFYHSCGAGLCCDLSLVKVEVGTWPLISFSGGISVRSWP